MQKEKYVLLIGDGMGDYALEQLGGKSPLEVAHTPNMDRIASGRIGLIRTIPDGMDPGSDVATLSILGYDPKKYHTGRAPLEAASMGVDLADTQVAFRLNLVTLDMRSDQEIYMVSHSSGDITTEEGRAIIKTVKELLVIPGIQIYPGVAYRHLLVWEKGPIEATTIPPHDVVGENMAHYLNSSSDNPIPSLIRRSWDILKNHPVNQSRRDAGLKEANSIWLWGQGKTPALPKFRDRFGLQGGVISAVDLLKGIGACVGFKAIYVEGATGYLDTNYQGKAEAALEALEELDFVFIHVEAPDEAGHNGNVEDKIKAIEDFDEKTVGTLLKGLARFESYRVMVASDHLTPIPKRTHTDEPTLFAWGTREELEKGKASPGFNEKSARKSGLFIEKGHELMPAFLT